MSELIGRFIAFKGDDEMASGSVLVEVTEVDGENVEIAFDAPIPGKPRLYISISLPELVKQSLKGTP